MKLTEPPQLQEMWIIFLSSQRGYLPILVPNMIGYRSKPDGVQHRLKMYLNLCQRLRHSLDLEVRSWCSLHCPSPGYQFLSEHTRPEPRPAFLFREDFIEPSQKSISMATLSSSHTQVFASAIEASALVILWYPSAASGDPRVKPTPESLLLQPHGLTDLHCLPLGLWWLTWQEPMSLWPQLQLPLSCRFMNVAHWSTYLEEFDARPIPLDINIKDPMNRGMHQIFTVLLQ